MLPVPPSGRGVEGADVVFPLRVSSASTPPEVLAKFPHLAGCIGLQLPPEALEQVRAGREGGGEGGMHRASAIPRGIGASVCVRGGVNNTDSRFVARVRVGGRTTQTLSSLCMCVCVHVCGRTTH